MVQTSTISPKFGAIGLVGFDDKCYPKHPTKADTDEVAAAIIKASQRWKNNITRRISHHLLTEIDLHIFFLPFPSVDDFRKQVLKSVGVS